MRRRIGQFAVALTAISVAAVLLVHAPFVRRAVLRYAVSLVEQQYGVRLEAERLDYNLATMRIGVSRPGGNTSITPPRIANSPFSETVEARL